MGAMVVAGQRSRMAAWLGIGAVAAALAVYKQWPEIRRYARMKRM